MKIMVSACLMGINCKYSARNNFCSEVYDFVADYECVLVCPEQLGGLSTPRIPAEIVIEDDDRSVINKEGEDVTEEFVTGAEKALKIAIEEKIDFAILKDGSPSCGVNTIYDGTFTGVKNNNNGIFAELLEKNGVICFDEKEIINGIFKNKEENK